MSESLDAIRRMLSTLKLDLARYEGGEPSIGRKVDQTDEAIAAILDAVGTIAGDVAVLEARINLLEGREV